jgi:putative glutamine amidotransferase
MRIALTLTKREITSAINNKYLEYVHNAGLQPISFDQLTPVVAIEEICDGLLLKGGADVDPISYGFDNMSSMDIDPELDEFERQLFWAFHNANKPIFGICRGFQLIFRELAVNNGETGNIDGLIYVQHIDGHNQARKDVKRPYAFHYVKYSPQVYDLNADGDRWMFLPVNSMHHQAVTKHTGKGSKQYVQARSPIVPLAWANNVLEAYRSTNNRVLAVQWHPEEMNDVALLLNIFTNRQEIEIEGL